MTRAAICRGVHRFLHEVFLNSGELKTSPSQKLIWRPGEDMSSWGLRSQRQSCKTRWSIFTTTIMQNKVVYLFQIDFGFRSPVIHKTE